MVFRGSCRRLADSIEGKQNANYWDRLSAPFAVLSDRRDLDGILVAKIWISTKTPALSIPNPAATVGGECSLVSLVATS